MCFHVFEWGIQNHLHPQNVGHHVCDSKGEVSNCYSNQGRQGVYDHISWTSRSPFGRMDTISPTATAKTGQAWQELWLGPIKMLHFMQACSGLFTSLLHLVEIGSLRNEPDELFVKKRRIRVQLRWGKRHPRPYILSASAQVFPFPATTHPRWRT